MILPQQSVNSCKRSTTSVFAYFRGRFTALLKVLKTGEGDLSLTYWQKEHESFLKASRYLFNKNSIIFLEEFELVFKN